jgi:endogenous inhibitor of DNA gyrase (YacG/DUF329 family)
VCTRGSNRALLRGPSTSPLDGTVFDSSVIARSGQTPKALCAFLGLVVGGGLALFGNLLFHWSPSFGAIVTLGGAAAGLGLFVFGCLSVRCPSCGARWVWDAISKRPANAWLASLLGSRVCPKCGYPDASTAPSNNRWRGP